MIHKRKSVRSFEKEAISRKDFTKIQDFLDDELNRRGPFNTVFDIRMFLETDLKRNEKLATYGFIKNAQGYIVGYSEKDTYSLLEFGFVFHGLILFLTEIGLGSCWLGGSFKRTDIDIINQFIPAITPIGYPTGERHLMESLMRKMIKSNKRKPFNELFGYQNLETVYEGRYTGALEYVRLAPSAKNIQPWRVIVDDEGVHFYLKRTIEKSDKSGDMQVLDIGIAMRQFYEGVQEMDEPGSFIVLSKQYDGLEYFVSWVKEEKSEKL